jgi:hypothetical protein
MCSKLLLDFWLYSHVEGLDLRFPSKQKRGHSESSCATRVWTLRFGLCKIVLCQISYSLTLGTWTWWRNGLWEQRLKRQIESRQDCEGDQAVMVASA